MTPAELRVARERLGLTGDAIAKLLDVEGRTLRRWEAGTHLIPEGVQVQVEAWEGEAEDLAAVMRGATRLVTYRNDESFWAHEPDRQPWPASWHRALVGRVKETGVTRIVYAEDGAR